jgi:hypothetical protein
MTSLSGEAAGWLAISAWSLSRNCGILGPPVQPSRSRGRVGRTEAWENAAGAEACVPIPLEITPNLVPSEVHRCMLEPEVTAVAGCSSAAVNDSH